jgi:ubiquinone/menaquinone biosynthesis C-methylase UbiE
MSDPSAMWGGGTYERIAERFAPVHDELVARLEPGPGVRWLDLATGTGGVALRAAHAGAEVTGLDFAPALLEQARAKAGAEGLEIQWDLGDAQALPYPDAGFDVASSSFGIIFAPDHEAVARELARVIRPEGRLGLANWRPNEGLHAIYGRFAPGESAFDTDDWGSEEHLQALLGDAFELEIEERVWNLEGDSPEDVWELMVTSAPPVKAMTESLGPERSEEFRQAMVDHWANFRVDGGRVSEPRRYLLVLGQRR